MSLRHQWTNPIGEHDYAFTVGAQGVPEPASAGVFLAGGMALFLGRRQQKI